MKRSMHKKLVISFRKPDWNVSKLVFSREEGVNEVMTMIFGRPEPLIFISGCGAQPKRVINLGPYYHKSYTTYE